MRFPARKLLSTGVALGLLNSAPALSSTRYGRTLFPVVTRVEGVDAVALTFDDGPDSQFEYFLTLLDDANVRATFFFMGEQVERHPEAASTIASAGHEIAVHGYTHRGHLRRSPWDLTEDLRRAKTIIEDVTQTSPQLYRPPYGVFTLGSWREAERQGWTRVLWSRWGRDWEESTSPQQVADYVGQPSGGDIVLLHDSDRYSSARSWENTLGALPIILERITHAGLKTCTVSEMLQTGDRANNIPSATPKQTTTANDRAFRP